LHKNKEEFEIQIREVIGNAKFKYQNLLYTDYDFDVFSLNKDYDLDYVKFNQIFSSQIKSTYDSEDYFESLITNNKINLANYYNFTRLYDDEYKETVWELMKLSIKLDSSEFVNLLIQKYGRKLSKMHSSSIIDLYKEVKIIFF
jgi:hypothetical protein